MEEQRGFLLQLRHIEKVSIDVLYQNPFNISISFKSNCHLDQLAGLYQHILNLVQNHLFFIDLMLETENKDYHRLVHYF